MGTVSPLKERGTGQEEMLELGRPGCVFLFPGMILGASTALPTGKGVYRNVQGVVGDGIQPFMDLCSLRFQPSSLAGSRSAIPERCRWKLLQQAIRMSCFWGSRVRRHPSGGCWLGTALEPSSAKLPSSSTRLSKSTDETWSSFQSNCSFRVGIPSPAGRINPLLSLWKRVQQ